MSRLVGAKFRAEMESATLHARLAKVERERDEARAQVRRLQNTHPLIQELKKDPETIGLILKLNPEIKQRLRAAIERYDAAAALRGGEDDA